MIESHKREGNAKKYSRTSEEPLVRALSGIRLHAGIWLPMPFDPRPGAALEP
jgi:hypothetical protein